MFTSFISEDIAGECIDDIRDLVLRLFAPCIDQPTEWYIIIEISTRACQTYYAVNFHVDSSKVEVALYEGPGRPSDSRTFPHFIDAIDHVAEILQDGFCVAYVEQK